MNTVMSIGIATAMAVGLCSCGKREDDSSRENAKNILARENVYAVIAEDVSPWVDCTDSFVDVLSTVCMNDKVCAVMRLQDRMENKSYYGVLTTDANLSDLKTIPLELPEEQQTTDENISYNNFFVSADERIYGLRVIKVSYDEESTGEHAGEQRAEVCCFNISGQMLWKSEISDLYSDGEAVTVRGFFASGDDSVNLLLFVDEGAYKIHIARDGELSVKEELSDKSAAMLFACSGMWSGTDGSIRVMYVDEGQAYMADYNIDTDTIGELHELPFAAGYGAFGVMERGRVSDLIYTETDGIFTYNKGDDQGTIQMNYVNSDINITYVDTLMEVDTKRFLAFFREYNKSQLEIGVFSYVEPEDVAEKKVVILGGSSIDSVMRQQVILFNRINDAYRIVLKEYDYDEFSHSYLKLNNDIVSGNMPDILVAEGLPVDSYIERGLVADVRPLIEQDRELSEVEFMENVFDAYSVDGKLMYVIPSFMVSTAVAKGSIVEDGADWSLKKVKLILEDMGERTQFMSEMTRDSFMEEAMGFWGNCFIDMGACECSFDSDEFISLMEFAATLPEENDQNTLYEGEDYWESYEAQYRDGRTLLMKLNIDCLNSSLTHQLNGYMGGDYAFVGFPGNGPENADGAYIYGNDLLVLSAKSENLEGAWEFVRYYLTDEYQEALNWGLPVNRDILIKKGQTLTEQPFYLDENGNKVEYYDDTLYYHGEDVPISPMTQTQLEQLIAYIESVKRTSTVNEDVLNIINEEMGEFYAGDKTAEDVAKLIQNRVSLYVEENQ